MVWSRRHSAPPRPRGPMVPAVQGSAAPSDRPLDHLEDEVTSAFFDAREYEAYYRSLQLAEERRAFHDQLRLVLLRLLRLADGRGFALLDDLVRQTSEEAEREVPAPFALSPAERVRRMHPDGMRFLGDDAGLDLEHLKASYRAAALRCHPDRGGSNEQMTAINLAHTQLHRILVEEGGGEVPWAPVKLSGTHAYLWAVRRLLFETALDEWALDDAAPCLEALAADKQLCGESQGRRLIDLVVPACKLTERLCAAGSVAAARASLAVAREGLRFAQARHLNFDGYVRLAAEAIAGVRKPHFILNGAKQIENAFRLGAIDRKRYDANMIRIAGRKERKNLDYSRRLALLAQAKFLPALPIDARLRPSRVIGNLVPHPGYFDYHSETLTSDQQAEYLKAFREGTDLALVAKYAFVRLSGLLRSVLSSVGGCDFASVLEEVQLLAQLEPRCAWSADGVGEVIQFLVGLTGGTRAGYASTLARLLEPQPQTVGIFTPNAGTLFDLTPIFFSSARELAMKYGAA
jgi:hypothetical protein